MTSTDLVSEDAQTLVYFAALPSLLLTEKQRRAFLAGARALEKEARAKAYDRGDDGA
jgi:hypothetical protein